MPTYAEKIQMVMNTLQELQMPCTMHNMNRLMGSLQLLAEIRDEFAKSEQEAVKDADADAE